MRIIAFGDVHMSAKMCRNIPGIHTADILLASGDLTNYGKQKDAKLILEQLLEINPNVLALIGNLDNFEINDYLQELDMNLHAQARLLQGKVCVIGAGGSNITPFGTPSEFTENELHDILMRGYSEAKEFLSLATSLKGRRIPTILVSHTPPRDTSVDVLSNGRHVGSSAVRSFIETHQPDICITGHIHEAKGEDTIGKTHIINPGMLQKGGWVDIQLIHSTLHATLK